MNESESRVQLVIDTNLAMLAHLDKLRVKCKIDTLEALVLRSLAILTALVDAESEGKVVAVLSADTATMLGVDHSTCLYQIEKLRIT